MKDTFNIVNINFKKPTISKKETKIFLINKLKNNFVDYDEKGLKIKYDKGQLISILKKISFFEEVEDIVMSYSYSIEQPMDNGVLYIRKGGIMNKTIFLKETNENSNFGFHLIEKFNEKNTLNYNFQNFV